MSQGARRSSVVQVLLAAVLICGAVAGCSGSSASPAGPTTGHPGTSPSSTTASATPSEDPGQAAIAAVKRMLDAYNAMLKSGSSKAYRATFTKECIQCITDAETVEQVIREKQTIVGGTYSVERLVVDHAYTDEGIVTLSGLVSQEAVRIQSHGQIVKSFEGFKKMPVGWSVSHIKDGWIVTRGMALR